VVRLTWLAAPAKVRPCRVNLTLLTWLGLGLGQGLGHSSVGIVLG
jgi:hypothetical protein